MKIANYRIKNTSVVLLLILSVFIFASCENEFANDTTSAGGSEPPIVNSVSEAREDTPVTQGVLENSYIIRGENFSTLTAIYFNGYRAGFNPALTTDGLTFVTIPEDAPYLGQDNILRVENLAGSTEYDFSLLTIEEFSEELIDGANAVILYGGDFTDVERVVFASGSEEEGNLVEREADIISVTESTVAVKVPDGVVQAFIYVYTSRDAIVQSTSYGFNYPIYTDAFNNWELGGWGEPQEESADVALGASSIKKNSAQWEGLTFTPTDDAEDLVLEDYSTMAVSIYPGDGVTRLKLRVNDADLASNNAETDYFKIDVIPNEWNKIVIPVNTFYPNGGAVEVINRIDFQLADDTSAGAKVYYIDQFGFVE